MNAREAYIEAAGNFRNACDFEDRVLAVGRPFLPACARQVLDGEHPTATYWIWLASRLDEHRSTP